MKVYLYIVGECHNPDKVRTSKRVVVPYKINEDLIFFGACKRNLRKKLYKAYLMEWDGDERDLSSEELYIIGFNASNSKKTRKIIWVGKILTAMTFERAFHWMEEIRRSSEDPLKESIVKLLDEEYSPMLVQPIYENGIFVGYEPRSKEHKEFKEIKHKSTRKDRAYPEWVYDLIDRSEEKEKSGKIKVNGEQVLLQNPAERKRVFDRDICFLCENLFFAEGKGLKINEKIIEIIRTKREIDTKRKRDDIDAYYIFGKKKNGNADGLPGWWLELEGKLARRFLSALSL